MKSSSGSSMCVQDILGPVFPVSAALKVVGEELVWDMVFAVSVRSGVVGPTTPRRCANLGRKVR